MYFQTTSLNMSPRYRYKKLNWDDRNFIFVERKVLMNLPYKFSTKEAGVISIGKPTIFLQKANNIVNLIFKHFHNIFDFKNIHTVLSNVFLRLPGPVKCYIRVTGFGVEPFVFRQYISKTANVRDFFLKYILRFQKHVDDAPIVYFGGIHHSSLKGRFNWIYSCVFTVCV